MLKHPKHIKRIKRSPRWPYQQQPVWLVIEKWDDWNECENGCRSFSVITFVAASLNIAREWVNMRSRHCSQFEWAPEGMNARAFMHEWEISEVLPATIVVE